MPMNKAEKAAFEDLRIQGALKRVEYDVTPLDPRDEMTGKPYGHLCVAWSFNTYNKRVSQGCFSSVYHANDRIDKTTSQGQGGPWYDTQIDALKAMRMDAQDKCARELAEVDAMIAAAQPQTGTK